MGASDNSPGLGTDNPSKRKDDPSRAVVALDPRRWGNFAKALVWTVLGIVLILKLATVGQAAGLAVLGYSSLPWWRFVRTLRKQNASIRVVPDGVHLPRAPVGDTDFWSFDKVHHAYFLRQATRFYQVSPVVVIETDERAYQYPRDWFFSDSDQWDVVRTINHHLE